MRSDIKNNIAARCMRRISSQKGFTLVELLISIVLFLMVTATVYGLLEIGRVQRNRSSRRSDILKNARVAIQLIGRDALNAGLGFNKNGARVPDGFLAARFGLPPDADTKRDLLSSIVVGNDIFTNSLSQTPGLKTDTIAFCYRDLSFNPPLSVPPGILPTGQVMPLSDVRAAGGNPAAAEVIADTTKNPAGARSAAVNDLYLIENDNVQTAIMATSVNGTTTIDAAPGDPLGLNQAYNAAGSSRSLLFKCAASTDPDCMVYLNTNLIRFFMVSYKVKPDGTLVRTVYGNNGPSPTQQIQEQPLAYNVEDLQIKYVLDDGTVTDNFAPTPGPDGVLGTDDDIDTAVNKIRQIQVTIKVQSTEIDEQTRKPETITLNATFATRNMEYDAG